MRNLEGWVLGSGRKLRAVVPAGLAAVAFSWVAQAVDDEQPSTPPLDGLQLESWLESDSSSTEPLETTVPSGPPAVPARHRGTVVEASVGALGHLGDMQNVSPAAPWFRLQVGYELFDWLMLGAQGDLALASTAFANRPPAKRSYALFGFGLGLRFAARPFDSVGIYLQGDGGLSTTNEDVLATYGYRDADRLHLYYGGQLGLEWYQVSPHYALVAHGGVRGYPRNFTRVNGGREPFAWVGGIGLRYAL